MRRLDPRYQTLAAIVGAGLAFATMAGVYAASAIPALDAVQFIRSIFEPDPFGSIGGVALAWAIAPISGAIAAGLVAPRALAGDRWAGSAMGVLTYIVAVIIGPLLVLGPMTSEMGVGPRDLVAVANMVAGMAMFTLIGSVVLLPLLVVCVAGGTVWVVVFRALISASGGLPAPPPARPFEAQTYIILFAIVAVGWLLCVASIGGPLSGGEFVD